MRSHTGSLRRAVLVALCLLSLAGLALAANVRLDAQAAAQASETPPVLQEAPPLLQDQIVPVSPRTGFIPPPMDLSHLRGEWPQTGAASLLSRWDWREQGKVSSVKNQNPCGACYAFASLGGLESRLLIDGAGLYDFSENNVKECDFYAGSCSGGNFIKVASFLAQKGSVLESCDPYQPSDVACKSTCPYQKTVLDWRIINWDNIPDTAVLKNYISTYGPVYVAFDAGGSDAWGTEFDNYNGSYTLYHPPTSTRTNHAVLIVGWDDSLSHAGGTGGWIVKNSWGTGWGGTAGYGSEKGYFTIAYGSANIGYYASFIHGWQDYDAAGGILYYDEGGWSKEYGYSDTTAWELAKFVPPSSANVTRIEFWTTDITTDVDVYLYDGFNGSTLSGLLASKLNLSFSEAGYHSVALDAPVAVAGGNDVFAVIKFTNSNYNYPIAADTKGPIETGKTYISKYGTSWTDLGTGYAADVAIRIRTGLYHATSTPTATRTPTATTTGVTHTPTVTRTPTATRTAGASWVYLPLVLKAPSTPATATPTPTQSVTPTPTPSPTATSSGSIYGTVSYNGIAAASVSLDLLFYKESSWSTASTRMTGADGRYNFTGMPTLGAGQWYYVRYTNPGNSLYVAGWWAPTITSYSAGSSTPGGDFDIANVSLLTPNDGVSLPLPVTFTWQKRTVPGDTYKWMIFDPSNPADRWGTSDLGNVGSFTLTSLGSGMVTGKQYGWYVLVQNGADSFGASYYYQTIIFTSTGLAEPAALPLRAWREERPAEAVWPVAEAGAP